MLPQLNIFGISISTYFLVISISSIISSLWFIRRAEKQGLRRVSAIDLTLVTLVCGFLGARLMHIFYEEPEFYIASPLSAFEVWNGGFVYLGGVVGAWFGALSFCLRQKEPFWFWADIASVPIAFGYGVGRLGCFLNGCCYGKFCELPWAVALAGGPRHPTQLYAFCWEMMVVGILLVIERRGLKTSGVLFNCWLFLHCLGRILMEMFRDDPRGSLIGGLSIGVWMSFGLGLFAAYNLVSTLHLQSSK